MKTETKSCEIAIASATEPDAPRGAAATDSESAAAASSAGGATANASLDSASASKPLASAAPSESSDADEPSAAPDPASADSAQAGRDSVASSSRDGLPLSTRDRKSTRLNSSHVSISYAVFCLKKKTKQ